MNPVVLLASAGLLAAQFSARVDVVEVYATVTTARGRPVTDLSKEDFVVREDGVVRPIALFAAGNFPLSVALALDHSWSMAGERLAVAKSAAHVFLGELRPQDEAMIVAVGDQVETVALLSRDRAAQHAAISRIGPWGTTALHDAMLESLDRIGRATGRRALIVLSDGSDRYSRATAEDVVRRARLGDALIYPIAMGPDAAPLFEQLADVTGGRAFHVTRPSQLASVFREIAAELRRQYLLGYEPAAIAAGPPGWRTIDVDVRRPTGARVRARTGYLTR